MTQRNIVKCNCHRLKYLVLYNKRVIALILRNIVPRSISYYTRKLVQYDILQTFLYSYVYYEGNIPMFKRTLRHTLAMKVTSPNSNIPGGRQAFVMKVIQSHCTCILNLDHNLKYFIFVHGRLSVSNWL
jgi:hypothetical protein